MCIRDSLQPNTMEAWIGWSAPGWGHPETVNGIGPFVPGAAAATDGLRLWLDAHRELRANAPLVEVQWYDARGRRLAGPDGRGPWLVHARDDAGRTARQWVR